MRFTSLISIDFDFFFFINENKNKINPDILVVNKTSLHDLFILFMLSQ